MDLEKLRENSGIRVDREGRFWYRESPVENEKVQALFARSISVREDGRVILTVGKQWCYVAVDDTPNVIAGVVMDSSGTFNLRLNNGEVCGLELSSLFLSEEGLLYCRLRGNPTLVRFSRNAFHTFADGWLVELPQGGLGVSVDGQIHPIRTGLRREIPLLVGDN